MLSPPMSARPLVLGLRLLLFVPSRIVPVSLAPWMLTLLFDLK